MRITGTVRGGKTLGVRGGGRIGMEVAKRATAFDIKVIAFYVYWVVQFAVDLGVFNGVSAAAIAAAADVLSLHMNLTDANRGFVNNALIATMKKGAMVINCARGGLVVEQDIADACRSGRLSGYGTDVLDHEPIRTPHPFQDVDNILVTPHIGSRTFESVERQALRATANLVNYLEGRDDYIQANPFDA
jgi:D-3-phosphoglycerate dehydrogenase